MTDDLWKLQLGTGILKPAIAFFQQTLCQLYMEALEQVVQTLFRLIVNYTKIRLRNPHNNGL